MLHVIKLYYSNIYIYIILCDTIIILQYLFPYFIIIYMYTIPYDIL